MIELCITGFDGKFTCNGIWKSTEAGAVWLKEACLVEFNVGEADKHFGAF